MGEIDSSTEVRAPRRVEAPAAEEVGPVADFESLGPEEVQQHLQRVYGNSLVLASLADPGGDALQGMISSEMSQAVAGESGGMHRIRSNSEMNAILARQQTITRMSSALGLSDVTVHVDPVARQRARGAGTPGLMANGEVFLDPESVDLDSRTGKHILAHELVHVAQRQLPGSGDAVAAEEEADRLGEILAAGGSIPRVQIALANDAEAHFELPEGVDMDYQGGQILARRSWLVAQGVSMTERGPAPAATALILDRLEDTSDYSWIGEMPARRRRAIAENLFTPPNTDQDVFPCPIRRMIFQFFGLPPGVQLDWIISENSAFLCVRADSGETPGTYLVTAERLSSAFDDLCRRTGLEADTHIFRDRSCDGDSMTLTVTKTELIAQFGSAWEAFPGNALSGRGGTNASPLAPLARPSPEEANVAFDEGVSEEDRSFARRFSRNLPRAEGGSTEITAEMIRSWRILDNHPLRDAILERIRTPRDTDVRGGSWDVETIEQLSAQVESERREAMRAELNRLLRLDGPALDEQLQGRIVNGSGLLFVGQEANFSFRTQHTNRGTDIVTMVSWVRVSWTVHSVDGTAIDSGTTDNRDGFGHVPENFQTEFPRPGEYVIHADCQHNIYQAQSFEIRVDVQSEEARRVQSEEAAFGDGDLSVVSSRGEASFGPAIFSEDQGYELEGELPESWQVPMSGLGRPSYDQEVHDLRTRVRELRELARTGPEALRHTATERADALQEALEEQDQERGSGSVFFHVEGAYLSRSGAAQGQTMNIQASARREDGEVVVTIHDYTMAIDTRIRHYSESGDTFRAAFRAAFYEICKDYPTGRMSVRGEELSDGLQRGTTWVGFELDTNSNREAARRIVWDPMATIGVNLAGTAAIAFMPATAVVIVPMLMAYNGIDTVATMWDLADSGALEATDVALGVGELLTDIVPVFGRAAGLAQSTIVLLEIAEQGVSGLLFAAGAASAVREIRANLVANLAPLHAEIQQLRADNPSDPRLPGLEQRFERTRMEAQENAQTQIRNMVGNHLLVAASSHAIGAAGQAVRGPETGAGVELGRDAELDLIRQRNDATAHVEASQLSQIAAAMNIGVDQRMMTGEHGGEVHVQFDRQGGRITGMTLRVGERVPLETVLGHIHAVRAMERYQGAVGILRNAIDHVRSLVRTGHFLSDGGREALFELEKLQPIVDRYVDLLSNTSMTEATRADVNAHRISLQEQIARQQERLNRTDPGLGYVASHEHVDSVGVGASAQPALDATATGDAVSTRLYRDNGEFWNPEIEDRYEAYRDRQRQAHPHREPSSRDRWIDTATRDGELQSALVTELGPGWRARRRTGRDRSPDHDASVGARREFSAGEDAAEIQALSDTRQSLREDARRIRERGVMSEADQSRRNAILQRMRDVSQRAGLLAADAYARREGFTERIYPGEGVPSRAGDFDRVYIRRTSTGTEILVLEAKGGRGTLGSAEFHGERYEQGSTGYLVRTIGTSPSRDLEVPYHPSAAFLAAHPEIESPLHITLNQAMRMAMEADRADGGHRLRYVLVEVPESRGGLASPRAADFELRPEGRRRGGE